MNTAQKNADLVTFIEEILKEKRHFLCRENDESPNNIVPKHIDNQIREKSDTAYFLYNIDFAPVCCHLTNSHHYVNHVRIRAFFPAS